MVGLAVQNQSARKWLYRRDRLQRLAQRIYNGEGLEGAIEVSVLFCDDDFIRRLNKDYRSKNVPTDVLSFEQEAAAGPMDEGDGPPRLLGDIVISLETVEHNCGGQRGLMREEATMLFCHGMLHLLGYDHANATQLAQMKQKQALYLETPEDTAWQFGPKGPQLSHSG